MAQSKLHSAECKRALCCVYLFVLMCTHRNASQMTWRRKPNCSHFCPIVIKTNTWRMAGFRLNSNHQEYSTKYVYVPWLPIHHILAYWIADRAIFLVLWGKKHTLKKRCFIIGIAEPGFQFALEGKDFAYSDSSPVEGFGPVAFGFGYTSIIRYPVWGGRQSKNKQTKILVQIQDSRPTRIIN